MKLSLGSVALVALGGACWGSSCTVKEESGGELAGSGGVGQVGTSSAGNAGSAGSQTSPGSGATMSMGGSQILSGVGGVLSTGGTATGGVGGSFDDCEAEVSVADQVGLDMYIVFDRSGSMDEGTMGQAANNGDCPIDLAGAPSVDSKWCTATNALARFFTTPTNRDVRAALQFMSPADSTNETLNICGPMAGNPHSLAAVDLTALPVDAANPLVALLEADIPNPRRGAGPNFGTRIEGALNGIVMYTSANLAPPRKTIGVLITDGDPNNCDEDEDTLGQIAEDHFTATGVPTFVIGMTGATAANLETIAVNAGGPEHGPEYCDPADATCHYWTVGDGDPAAFSAVLEAIQDSVVIPCEYTIPTPAGGAHIDPALVVVTFYDGTPGADPVQLSKVDNEAACDPVVGGWFFDDPAAPTAVRLCQSSCETAGVAVSGAEVQIRYGCTEILE